MMQVGVVIPAFNAARWIERTVESVLMQTAPPSRIVVVDDGSIDGTARLAEKFGSAVLCVRQENRGVAAARNRGARESQTEWVAFLDADDVWLPTKLERQWERVRDTDAGAIFTAVDPVAADLEPIPRSCVPNVDDDLAALLLHRATIPQGTSSTLLVRYSLFAGIGGYDENLSTMADWDLLIRLRLRTKFAHVLEPLVLYRRGAMSRNVDLLQHDSVRTLHKAFASTEIPPSLQRLRRRCLAWNDLVLSGSYFGVGSYSQAVKHGVRSVLRDPVLAGRILGSPFRHLKWRWSQQRVAVASPNCAATRKRL